MVKLLENGWRGANNQFFATAQEAVESINKFKSNIHTAIDGIESLPSDAKKAIKDVLSEWVDSGIDNLESILKYIQDLPEMLTPPPELFEYGSVVMEYLIKFFS
jgi:gas vesicle protein